MKKPYRHFDLPRKHLTGEAHYIPPKARDPEEIERRRSRPAGALLAEQQRRGLQIASLMLEKVSDEPDVLFAKEVLAPAGLNSAWYGFARDSEVMRRRLRLPVLAAIDHPIGFDPNETQYIALARFETAAAFAARLEKSIEAGKPGQRDSQIKLGRIAGEAALTLACVTIGGTSTSATARQTQTMVRQESILSLASAQSMAEELGTPPSLAQLADPDSDLSVYIRRHAPDGMYQAFEEAVETYRVPT